MKEAEDAFILPAPDTLEPRRSMGGQGCDVTGVGARPSPLHEYITLLFLNSFQICPLQFSFSKVGYKSVFGGVGTRGKIRVKVFHSPSPPNTTPFQEWGDSYSKDNG
ncbi:hypothetical protein CDAR_543161 [Caerostris darwini]|uniref:Uncharacterized protein n=1 Tax=Caerostris darwini TaxID=1538125 RepID=A0AAV4X4I6_9ARAC|nr:hypothetical protein CDAR_543161 [Caerostris darwini]